MDSNTVATGFAIGLFAGWVGIALAMMQGSTRRRLANSAVIFSALVAVGATAGSLYLSEVAGFVPCELCWFQRIAMYPLALVFSIAAVRRDNSIFVYALPLAVAGLAIALYHVQLQAFPDQASFCELDNPCSDSPLKVLGFLTIPQMSALAFGLIVATGLIQRFSDKDTVPFV